MCFWWRWSFFEGGGGERCVFPFFLSLSLLLPSSLSLLFLTCTIPMTGLFACGDTMFLGTAMIAIASALASGVCGTCMFISSPSKSALYGDVTLRLRRKVECGRMRTRWPIIDILCSEGWRLNSTMSPFWRWRSTRKPYSRWRSASRRTKRRSRRWPSSRTMNLKWFVGGEEGGGGGVCWR